MGAALMVVPAIAAAWLWVAPRGRVAALRQLGLGGAAMAVVGLAWPVLVWLTPASDRPWISGTSDNSIWSLIFGYNGLGRLTGQQGAPGGGGPGRRRRRRRLRRRPGRAAAAEREPGRAGRLAAGLRGWWPAIGLVVLTRLRRGDARTGWLDRRRRGVPDDRGGVQPGLGDLPSLLRVAARAVHGGAGGRRRRRDPARRACRRGSIGPLAIARGDRRPSWSCWARPRRARAGCRAADRGRRHGRATLALGRGADARRAHRGADRGDGACC